MSKEMKDVWKIMFGVAGGIAIYDVVKSLIVWLYSKAWMALYQPVYW